MFKVKNVIVFLILSLPFLAWAQSASERLAGVLQNLNSMQANFVETTYDSHGKALQKSNGTMALQRPGKFRWQTMTPNNQIIIADGNYIWLYNVDLQQATRQKQDQKSNQNNPAALLSGSTTTLQQQFDVSAVGQNFELRPKNRQAMFDSIQLDFRDNTLQRMQVRDNLGQLTVFDFSQAKVNIPLSATLFQFMPPKGTDIINQ